MKEKITQITLDCMMGIREGVGQCRVAEFSSYLQNLIQAKQAEIDVSTIQFPMLSDRVKQGVEASLSAKSKSGVEGGLEWTIIGITGSHSSSKQQGIRVKVDMEFMSIGAPDFEKLQAMSVEELEKLMKVVNE